MLIGSVALHLVALVTMVIAPRRTLPNAGTPPAVELLLGHGEDQPAPRPVPDPPAQPIVRASATSPPPRPAAPRATPSLPLPEAGHAAAPLPVPPPPPPAPSAPLPTPPAPPARPEVAGVRLERSDPSVIPATADPGNPAPRYPNAARRRRAQGEVLLRLSISATGEVSAVKTLRSSGDAALDSAAAFALAHWHFRPAKRDGRPVASYRDQPVRFELQG